MMTMYKLYASELRIPAGQFKLRIREWNAHVSKVLN